MRERGKRTDLIPSNLYGVCVILKCCIFPASILLSIWIKGAWTRTNNLDSVYGSISHETVTDSEYCIDTGKLICWPPAMEIRAAIIAPVAQGELLGLRY